MTASTLTIAPVKKSIRSPLMVPKIVLMTITMLVVLPWAIQRVMEYTTALFLDIPSTI